MLVILAWRNNAHNILCLTDTGLDYEVLPIIYNIRKVKIIDAYHKFLGLARVEDSMALS